MAGAVAPIRSIGIDVASGEEKVALNFACICGEYLIAEAPKNEGSVVKLPCKCGNKWELTWAGDHFKTKLIRKEEESNED